MIDQEMGTRHRAALGISEETDAIVVLISEEKARISVAENGRFAHINMDDIALRKYLNDRMFIASGD
jgi:diadenylate cyclase